MKKVNGSEHLEGNKDYQEMVNLLAVFTEASNRLAQIQVDVNNLLIDTLDDMKADYAETQEAASKAEAALKAIALKHPEWFSDRKSVKTPYGTLKFHASTELVVPNEEATLAKLDLKELRYAQAYQRALHAGTPLPEEFKAERFIRTRSELNLEALDTLDDATLQELGVARVAKENFSAVPAKVDMGRAVKEAAAKQQQEAA